MLYIITEDSTSARDFWECVARTFRGKGNYMMVKLPLLTDGNTTLDTQVKYALELMNKGDELFVAFDNVYPTESFDAAMFIDNTAFLCDKNNISFYYTDYYCFEELYLLYEELFNMAKLELTNKIVISALYCVKESIKSGIDYFIERPVEIQRFLDINKDATENREHFANQLLVFVTKRLKGFFGIIKAKKCFSVGGRCWLKSCIDIQSSMTEQHIHSICDLCSYCCKDMSTKDKLLGLDAKTHIDDSAFGLSQI